MRHRTLRSLRPVAAGSVSLALVLVAAAAALTAAPAHAASTTSEKYGSTAWRADGAGITVIVDARLAGMRETEALLPVPLVLGVEGKGLTLSLTPENFTLVDAAGNEVPAAGFEEFRREYGKAGFDRRVLRSFPIPIGSRFTAWNRMPANFYPAVGGGVRLATVHLPRFGWFGDVLYFPRPASLDGVLTLRIRAAELEHPVDVKFLLPGAKAPAPAAERDALARDA